MVFVDSLLFGLPTACSEFYLAVQKLACLPAWLLPCCLHGLLVCFLSCLPVFRMVATLAGGKAHREAVGWLVACLSACLLNSYGYSLDWGIRSQQAM
jgi:hypothetical protein